MIDLQHLSQVLNSTNENDISLGIAIAQKLNREKRGKLGEILIKEGWRKESYVSFNYKKRKWKFRFRLVKNRTYINSLWISDYQIFL